MQNCRVLSETDGSEAKTTRQRYVWAAATEEGSGQKTNWAAGLADNASEGEGNQKARSSQGALDSQETGLKVSKVVSKVVTMS